MYKDNGNGGKEPNITPNILLHDLPDIEAIATPVNGETPKKEETDFAAKAREQSEKVRQLLSKQISIPPPLVAWNGSSVITKGVLNVISGKIGAHKSRLAGNIAGLFFEGCNKESYLEFSRTDFTGRIAVVYADIERAPDSEFPLALQSYIRTAGIPFSSAPTNLHPLSLFGLPTVEYIPIIRDFLAGLSGRYDHIILVLDVVQKLLADFNNPIESNHLVNDLRAIRVDFSCTMLGVIHENPGAENEKAKGHIGTLIWEDASNLIRIAPAKNIGAGVYKIEQVKCRNGKNPEPFLVGWNDDARGLVVLDADAAAPKIAVYDEALIRKIFADKAPAKILTNLAELYMLAKEISKKTAHNHLNKAAEDGLIRKPDGIKGWELTPDNVPF